MGPMLRISCNRAARPRISKYVRTPPPYHFRWMIRCSPHSPDSEQPDSSEFYSLRALP